MAKRLKGFRYSARNCTLYDEIRHLAVFVVTNGCRASFPCVYHAKNGGRFDLFLPGVPVVAMAQETGIEPKPVLPALNYLRLAFQTDCPIFFPSPLK